MPRSCAEWFSHRAVVEEDEQHRSADTLDRGSADLRAADLADPALLVSH